MARYILGTIFISCLSAPLLMEKRFMIGKGAVSDCLIKHIYQSHNFVVINTFDFERNHYTIIFK